ncbi:hypothetical protein EPUL_001105 [Erysiphe pulchra]|uniref:Spc7 kinetochore protein domain-containing protein n=1 Tax=Erysiphe pulchra TaxID=225359 RepID=A0A2S4PX96_9PEZI|nr:hypothetical protein EPUL_001105 [Erysiphe pulchra]
MSSPQKFADATRKRSKNRKSFTHVPSSQTLDLDNRTTDLGSLSKKKREMATEKNLKKSRSKSIGPGGIDSLNVSSASTQFQPIVKASCAHPRPILKLTMPPLQQIPVHVAPRQRNSLKTIESAVDMTENLIDLSFESCTKESSRDESQSKDSAASKFAGSQIGIHLGQNDKGGQEILTSDQIEKEREKLQNEINLRRDARRKSLANRRVSFAPEATLHTWDVLVEYQDSTSSTNSTSTTKKAHSLLSASLTYSDSQIASSTNLSSSKLPTLQNRLQESIVDDGLLDHVNTHQTHQRNSELNNAESNVPDNEDYSSSPCSVNSIDDVEEDNDGEVNDDVASLSDSDSSDDGTIMSIDGGETTNLSMVSKKSRESTNSSLELDKALRQAASQAGTQGIDYDENYESSRVEEMEMVIPSSSWFKKNSLGGVDLQCKIENKTPSLQTSKINPQEKLKVGEEKSLVEEISTDRLIPSHKPIENEEMSMDVTRALGRIINNGASQFGHQSEVVTENHHIELPEITTSNVSEGETMDITVGLGGIQPAQDECIGKPNQERTKKVGAECVVSSLDLRIPDSKGKSEDFSHKLISKTRESFYSSLGEEPMDVTKALGGIISSVDSDQDTAMDVTTALGGIISSVDSDQDTAMDVTTAFGGIIKSTELDQDTITKAKNSFSAQVNYEKSQAKQTRNLETKKKSKINCVNYSSKIENGSPSLNVTHGKASKRNSDLRISKNPRHKKIEDGNTPVKKTPTPSKNSTPLLAPPILHAQVSPSSPQKRLYNSKIMAPASSAVSNENPTTPKNKSPGGKNLGFPIPNLTLTAKSRHASGIGFDKIGLGSPRVAELLDRRDSIGNNASSFILGELVGAPLGNGLKDPRLIEQEINNEREEEARHIEENYPRHRTEVSFKESNATSNLKEMIQSLTPKKNPIRGRKSLHVGAAVGLLGKRPVELDETDDTDDFEGTKRLKTHQGSPVKNVKLQAPPSKIETTSGRAIQALQNGVKNLASDSVFTKKDFNSNEKKPTDLKYQSPKKKDLQQNVLRTSAIDTEVEQKCPKDQRIQLQEFLNMTSIRFMELTTTKRRHTIAPKSALKNNGTEEKEISREDCVAAGAATIPMLELFQHACHELKRYISEGRKTVREIETETWEENPPLFREYISATPDLKFLMDNQLKNVKTHSRLLSKGQWYDWRMTLHGTLKEGLVKSAEGMVSDEETLNKQQTLLSNVLPPLLSTAQNLEQEKSDLQAAAQELASCNKEELSIARQRLTTVDENLNAKKIHLAELQQQLHRMEKEIEVKLQFKQKLQESIKESEKIKEECRGWTVSEIHAIKSRVEKIEEMYGWTITGISSSKISMIYQKEIRLEFNILFFAENMRAKRKLVDPQIDIDYVGSTQKSNRLSLITKTKFFIPCIRKYMQQEAIRMQCDIRSLLEIVSKSWKKAARIAQEVHLLTLSCPTEISELAETSMAIRSTLLIGPLMTKVALHFYLSAKIFHTTTTNDNDDDDNKMETNQEFDFIIKTKASVIYGERFNEHKMAEFLINRCGSNTTNSSSWGDAVEELGEKLLARGRK